MTLNEPIPHKIFLRGEYDLGRRDELVGRLSAAIDSRPATVLVDCADLTFIDAGTIGVLVRSQRMCSALGMDMRIVHVDDPHVRLVLETAGVWDRLTASVPSSPAWAQAQSARSTD